MNTEIKISFQGGMKVCADYNGFEIRTDQSVQAGGEGSAPEPFGLFLASIGTCAGIYVLRFCQTRGISTDQVSLLQQVLWDESGKLAKVTILIKLPPDFPEKYREPVVRAAKACTVKRAIHEPPEFEVKALI